MPALLYASVAVQSPTEADLPRCETRFGLRADPQASGEYASARRMHDGTIRPKSCLRSRHILAVSDFAATALDRPAAGGRALARYDSAGRYRARFTRRRASMPRTACLRFAPGGASRRYPQPPQE